MVSVLHISLIAMPIIMFAAVVAGVSWLVWGSRISSQFGRFSLRSPLPQSFDPLTMTADRFILGSRSWSFPREGAFQLKLTTDPNGRLVINVDGRAFTLGPVHQMWSDPVRPEYRFVPESDDVVSFTRSVSRLTWPTLFHFSIIRVPASTWRRHVYNRLSWKKKSGETLEILWRDEQRFYPRSGWSDQYNNKVTRISVYRP